MIRNWILKTSKTLASVALMVGVASTSRICLLWYHQPKIPEGMKKYKRIENIK